MNALDVISIGALLVLAVILLVLLMQALKLSEIWQILLGCQKAARWASIWETENKELRSALRAEKEHVEQLQRKLELLQPVVSVV